MDDIQNFETFLLITIRESKTKIDRVFTVIDKEQKSPSYLDIYRKYSSLRDQNDQKRFFLYYKNGKCTRQVIGKNTFGQIPFRIATYLGISNAKEYTGHCFRRSSATMLADAGEDIINIKRHAGWKSTTVAEGYIENSVANKLKIAKKIVENDEPSTSHCRQSENIAHYSETPDNNMHSLQTSSNKELVEISNHLQQQKTTNPNISINNCSNCIVTIKL